MATQNVGAWQRLTAAQMAAGKCFLDMLGVFAEFETNLLRERQLEGFAKAKVAGVYNQCWNQTWFPERTLVATSKLNTTWPPVSPSGLAAAHA